MAFSAGQRVYIDLVNESGTIKWRRPGIIVNDDIPGWDYSDVRFDDWPELVQPVLSYYLFPEAPEAKNEGEVS